MWKAVRPDRVDFLARAKETIVSEVQVRQRGSSVHSFLRQDRKEKLVFERLRAAIDAALAAAKPAPDLRDLVSELRQAVIELRAAVAKLRDDLVLTERRLEAERRSRNDAERRGRLAGEIGDQETVDVARQFTARHAERIGMLEQKVLAQRTELALVERELEEMTDRLKAAERDRPSVRQPAARHRGAPDGEPGDEVLQRDLDRQGREAAAEAQLRELKRKMGK
jgi:hypothetical protein